MQNTAVTAPELVIGLSSEHAYREIIYPHTHARAQLLYPSQGTIQVYTPQHIWIIPPMYALWIPAYMEHSTLSLSQVTLTTALIEVQAAQVMGQECFLIQVTPLLRELLIRLNSLAAHPHPKDQDISHELSQSLQILIFDEIQRATSLSVQIPLPKDKRLAKICDALLASPDHLKDLSTWADHIGTSPRTLMRMFQKETGLSYRAWIQQMHIAIALSKIANGESIAHIAETLGYSNPSAFSAMFKRHLGKTPQQFRVC